jgi:hypothetical protein
MTAAATAFAAATVSAAHDLHGELFEQVEPAARREDVAAAMQDFYRRVDAEIAARSPRCTNRGECCNFGRHGHRLFVTTIELAAFRRAYVSQWHAVDAAEDRCPWHVGGVCTAREHRPLGCRVYFCDPDAAAWQGNLYEAKLTELKGLMAGLEVRYRYAEWLSALGCFAPAEPRDSAGQGLPVESRGSAPGGIDPGRPRTIELTVVNQAPARPV